MVETFLQQTFQNDKYKYGMIYIGNDKIPKRTLFEYEFTIKPHTWSRESV